MIFAQLGDDVGGREEADDGNVVPAYKVAVFILVVVRDEFLGELVRVVEGVAGVVFAAGVVEREVGGWGVYPGGGA